MVGVKVTRDQDRRLFEEAVAALDEDAVAENRRDEISEATSGSKGALSGRRLSKSLESIEPDGTLDLHGYQGDEAAQELSRFLNAHAKPSLLLIVHGKGGGVLRRRVHQVLDGESRVAEHLAAPRRLGGDGARLIRWKGRSR